MNALNKIIKWLHKEYYVRIPHNLIIELFESQVDTLIVKMNHHLQKQVLIAESNFLTVDELDLTHTVPLCRLSYRMIM